MADKIHLWDALALARALHEDKLSDKTILNHFIIFSILFSGFASLPIGPSIVDSVESLSEELAKTIVGFIPYAIIVYYGTWYTYQINRKGDSKAFFQRFFCLTLPVSLRLSVYVVAIMAVVQFSIFGLSTLLDSALMQESVFGPIGGFLIGTGWSFAYYWLMGKYMAVASGRVAS